MVEFLETTPTTAPRGTILLAHGAGAPMDSPFMAEIAGLLGETGLAVLRFEFPYMAGRRIDGVKRPPQAAEKLVPAFIEAIAAAKRRSIAAPLLIGGKSLGGRVAAITAGNPDLDPEVAGIVCLGYPFHAPGRPERVRLAPLENACRPVLVAQGERDPFGNRAEVAGYALPDKVETIWLADGDHDLKPRKASGVSHLENLRAAAQAVATFAARLGAAA